VKFETVKQKSLDRLLSLWAIMCVCEILEIHCAIFPIFLTLNYLLTECKTFNDCAGGPCAVIGLSFENAIADRRGRARS
jgi:hypothetical protein